MHSVAQIFDALMTVLLRFDDNSSIK